MSFELAQPSLKIGLARVRSWQMPPELLMSTLMDTFWTPAVPGPFSHRDAQSLAPLGQLWRCLREPLDLTQMQEALQGVSRTDPAAASWRETSPALRPGIGVIPSSCSEQGTWSCTGQNRSLSRSWIRVWE